MNRKHIFKLVVSCVVPGMILAAVIIMLATYAVQRTDASASQNNLTLLLQQLDSTGSPILNRTIGKLSYDGNVGVFTNGIYNDTSAHSQTLPSSPVIQFYFRNTHATAVYTVTWTTQGGASVVAQKVQPGGAIAFWNTATSVTAGITALTLTSDTSGGTYEMFLGG